MKYISNLTTFALVKRHVRSWLEKQALWQLHIPPPKEINQPHFEVAKPNMQRQSDKLYFLHTVFEGTHVGTY